MAAVMVRPEASRPARQTWAARSALEGAEITVAEMAGGETTVDELTDAETIAIDVEEPPR